MNQLPIKYADASMYEAEPMRGDGEATVTLLNATPMPLRTIATACGIYEGKVRRTVVHVPEQDALDAYQNVLDTHLRAPLEFVSMHFLIEGVTRSFTHQMVRQRTAVYAQESLRFAVKENAGAETAMPPSIAELPENDRRREIWNEVIKGMTDRYNYLIANGIPAEDARGLLPHATTTRLHYHTNLRNLIEHAGNRLCTQAQFEWRDVFIKIVQAIAQHEPLVYI